MLRTSVLFLFLGNPHPARIPTKQQILFGRIEFQSFALSEHRSVTVQAFNIFKGPSFQKMTYFVLGAFSKNVFLPKGAPKNSHKWGVWVPVGV